MADPLSITTGVVSLLGTIYTLGAELKRFREDVTTIDPLIDGLINDAETLRNILDAINTGLNKDGAIPRLSATGHIGGLWTNMTRSLKDTQRVCDELLTLLQSVNKPAPFLSRPRKVIRYRWTLDKLQRYGSQIAASKQTMQLALQTMAVWDQLDLRTSAEQINTNLIDLDSQVRKLAKEIKDGLERIHLPGHERDNLVRQEAEQDRVLFANLQECIRSSASILSAASTENERRSTARASTVCESLFPDYQDQNDDTVLRWMAVGVPRAEPSFAAPPSVVISLDYVPGPESSNEIQEPEDFDLDEELARVTLKHGRSSFANKEFEKAEGNFRSCLAQLGISNRAQSREVGEVRSLLIDTLVQQKKWPEARLELQKKLASHRKSINQQQDQDALFDRALLIDVLIQERNYAEAQLYGRQLLSTYRKLGVEGNYGVKLTLETLVRICSEGGFREDEQAWVSMLMVMTDELQDLNGGCVLVPESPTTSSNSKVEESIPQDSTPLRIQSTSGASINDLPTDARVDVSPLEESSCSDRTAEQLLSTDRQTPGYILLTESSVPAPNPQGILASVPIHPSDRSSVKPPVEVPNLVTSLPGTHDTPLLMEQSVESVITPGTLSSSAGAGSNSESRHSLTKSISAASTSPGSCVSSTYDAQATTTPRTSVEWQSVISPNLSPRSPAYAEYRRKLVCLGDPLVGKTALLSRQAKGSFERWMSTTSFENYTCTLTVASMPVELAFFDTNGQDEYDHIRPSFYANTDIVLLCFAINVPHALTNIEEKWVHEIRHHLDGVPVVLVGTMSDLRKDNEYKRDELISTEDGTRFAESIGALKYFECSAQTGENVRELFEYTAMQTIMRSRKRAQNRRSFNSMLRPLAPLSEIMDILLVLSPSTSSLEKSVEQ